MRTRRAITLVLAVCAFGAYAAEASASSALDASIRTSLSAKQNKSKRLKVKVGVGVSDKGSVSGVRVTARTRGGSRCGLTVSVKKARQRLPRSRTSRKGRVSWRWIVPERAPSGKWSFLVRCRKGKRSGSAREKVLILTQNRGGRRGQLIAPSTLSVGGGGNGCWFDGSSNRYCAQQCTWYVKSQYPEVPNGWGNAANWDNAARAHGWQVGSEPRPGSIAVWEAWGGVYTGHVAIVNQDLGGGRISVREMNWVPYSFSQRVTSTGSPGSGRPSSFIYPPGRTSSSLKELSASLDGQSPTPGFTVTAGGPSVELAFNIRMNQPFSTAFILRPENPTESTIQRFVSVRGDFPGTRAPSDAAVGFYRARIAAPEGTPPGSYYLQWVLIDGRNGRVTGFRPSMRFNVRTGTSNWFLRNSNSAGAPDFTPFGFGNVGYQHVVGDWDGDGDATPGVFRPSIGRWYLRNSNRGGPADLDFRYASPGDIAVAGDFDGDGDDTVGVFRPSNGTWYLKNENNETSTPTAITFASAGDQPVVGDWDGNGTDTIGVFRPSNGTWYIKASNTPGGPDSVFTYGSNGDRAVAGDWDGNGSDGIGVFRPQGGQWFLKNALGSGPQNFGPFGYGVAGDHPVAGDFDGNGSDTVGVVRDG